jgi:hypothetical protein
MTKPSEQFVSTRPREPKARLSAVQAAAAGSAVAFGSRVSVLSRGPNAGSICDHSTGSDTDPRRNRTPNARDVDNSGSYGISTDASIRRHPCRMSYEHSDGHTHRSVQKCARPRLSGKGPPKPSMQRQRAAWLWKLLTCFDLPTSANALGLISYHSLHKKVTSPTNGSRIFISCKFRAVTNSVSHSVTHSCGFAWSHEVLAISTLAGIALSGKNYEECPSWGAIR